MTHGLLAFNDLWKPCYAILTPHDLTVQLEDSDSSPLLAFEVAEVIGVERLSQHERNGFEPFCVSLVDGSHFFAAAADHLGGALWTLKIENARSGAFRRSPDLQRLSAGRPSLASQSHSGQKTARESHPLPSARSPLPAASSPRPFPPGFAHKLTIPSSTRKSPHRLDATSPPRFRSSDRIGWTQNRGHVTEAQSSETATRDDRKPRRRRMQELFLDVEARFHEQQQQQTYSYEAQQRIAQVVSGMLELAERDGRNHEAVIASLTSQLDDIFANERKALPSPSSSFGSPPPAPPSALLSPVSPRSTMPIVPKKVKQRPEAFSERPSRAPPPAPQARRLRRKRSVLLRKDSARPSGTLEPAGVTQSATLFPAEAAVALKQRPNKKLAVILETPGLPEKVARAVYETVKRARRMGEAEKQATTLGKSGTAREA